jgi:hypothetical protein
MTVASTPDFLFHFKMADVEISHTDARLAPVKLGEVTFCMLTDLRRMKKF